jgi:hypothetical protein
MIKNVHVVDDRPAVRNAIRFLLSSAFWGVIVTLILVIGVIHHESTPTTQTTGNRNTVGSNNVTVNGNHDTTPLEQRSDELGSQILDWLEEKEKASPDVYVIDMPTEQEERYTEYWKQARKEYQNAFAPRVIALYQQLDRCGVDTGNLWPKITEGWNETVIKSIGQEFRAIAPTLPDDDSQLNCHSKPKGSIPLSDSPN